MQTKNTAEYRAYALHCLELARTTLDRDSRVLLREMAAEWLRLADAATHTSERDATARRA